MPVENVGRLLQAMTKRELYCPNLLVRKMVPTVPPPRPVKPVHPPIADIVKVVCFPIMLFLSVAFLVV